MITAQQNNIESITVLIKDKDLASVKAILNFLKEKYPNFSAMKFRTGQLGKNILVSFKVRKEYYPKILEKFAYNDIPIMLKDKNSLEFVEEKKEIKRKKLRAQGWSEITVSKKQTTLHELAKWSEAGKVKEVLKEAKGDVSSKIEIVKKAKALLTPTINIAIDQIEKYAAERIGKREDAINELLLIASDKDLKLLHKHNDLKRAGLTAIEISLSHENYYDYLIKIANHSKLNHFTNIKALLALAQLYFAIQDENTKEFPDVIKLLNTRWLRITFETTQKNLSEEEKSQFNNFLNIISEKRTAA